MISSFKTVQGLRIKFGDGTLRLRPHVLQSRFGTQLEIMNCQKTTIGEIPTKVTDSNKVVLEFSNVASLDVLIAHLQHLRNEMVDENA